MTSLDSQEVECILALAEAVTGDVSNYEMWAALTPETVRQLCNAWLVWADHG